LKNIIDGKMFQTKVAQLLGGKKMRTLVCFDEISLKSDQGYLKFFLNGNPNFLFNAHTADVKIFSKHIIKYFFIEYFTSYRALKLTGQHSV